MNRIFRSIWSHVSNTWVAVSENAKGRSKSSTKRKILITALALSLAPLAQAEPTGGQVVSGSGTISQAGSTTNIQQTSQNLSLNWQTFNVSPTETINYQQPSATAIAVNRIFDTNGSQILGQLNANGQVWLINPNGVLFGQGAQVNVGGLVASTLDFNDAQLGSSNVAFSGTGTGSIINQGTINAANGGYVALLGKHVDNQGVIVAQLGSIALGAGSAATLTFNGNALVHMQVDQSTLDNLAENGGLIQANGGQIVMTAGAQNALLASVVNNTGILEARAVENQNGTIILSAGTTAGTANIGGTVDVSSATGNGGNIIATAHDVLIANNTNLNATGATGGGSVNIGGGWQGSGDIAQATTLTMQHSASIDASATQQGDGGQVVLWSDVHNATSQTTVNGSIMARGGVYGGSGGNVETSGHQVDIDGAKVNAGAPAGAGGEWLIDPYSYTISVAQVSAIVGDINSGLNSGTSVTVDTALNNSSYGSSGNAADAGDITVTAAINKTSGGNATFTLKAARHISLQSGATIGASSGLLNLQLWADSDNSGDGIVQVTSTSIDTHGGWLKFGNNQTASINGSTVLVGGDVFFNGASTQTISTGGGALDIYGETIVSNSGGLTLDSGGGNVGLHGVLNSGNSYAYVDGPDGTQSWTWARTDAKNGTAGGSAVGNSYLVTITSRLENALAGLAAGYKGAWIGAYRANPTSSFAWTWADGPEAGAQFYTQNSSGGGGTTTASYYSNFGSGEPNGTLAGNESAGQFFGTAGLWNDLTPNTTFSATPSVNQYAVLGYVRETNLASSAVTINAGTGQVTIDGGVGGSKALAAFTVDAASTTINGSALVTTGAQTYDNALTVNSTGDLRVAASTLTVTNVNQALSLTATGNITIDSPSSVAGPISVFGSNITLNNNLTSTAQGAAILVSASGNIATANTAKTIATNNGNISLVGDADANGAGLLDLDYITMSAGSGNVVVRGETFSWAVSPTESPTVSSTTGTFTFESSDASFGQGVDTAWFNLPSTLSGLTVGKSTNTQDVAMGSALSVAGPISIYGSNINLNANLTSTLSGADILAKATAGIVQAASVAVTSNGGDITYWSNSADGTSGGIYIKDGGTLDSRTNTDRDISNISTATGGGTITLGGGSSSSTLASGTLAPTGYAQNIAGTSNGVGFGTDTYNGHNANIKLYSGGGNITVHGKSTVAAGSVYAMGVQTYGGVTMDAGTNGNLMIDGQGIGSGYFNGVELGSWAAGSVASLYKTSGSGNISITGTASGGTSGNMTGVSTAALATIEATGTGAVSIAGSNSASTAGGPSVRLGGAVLASSGDINVEASNASGWISTWSTIGRKAGSDVAASSSNVRLSADNLSINTGSAIDTSGTLTLQPYGNDFSAAFTMQNLTLASTLTGLTIGKSATSADGTSDVAVTIGSATSINGPINIYGSNINLNANLTSTASDPAILAQASGNVLQAASVAVTTNGGSVTYDANSTGSGSGGIVMYSGASITSNGGNITLGGGLTPNTTYAMGTSASAERGIWTELGTTLDARGSATGGNIVLNGQGTAGGEGILLGYSGTGSQPIIQTNNAGTISINGWGGAGLTNRYTTGIGLASGVIKSGSGAINIVGRGGGNSNNQDNSGIYLWGSGTNILSTSGAISLTGTVGSSPTIGSGIQMLAGSVIGYDSNLVASSSSDITLTSDTLLLAGSLQSSGALVIEPLTTSFSSAFSTSGLSISGNPSSLRLGKAGNTADITLANAFSIAGPISIYGGNINIIANLASTTSGADILAKAGGDIVQASGIAVTTNGGDVILWANSDGQSTNGGVFFDQSSSVNTAGGHIWIGGGSGSTTWNGLTVGDGFAVSGKYLSGFGIRDANTITWEAGVLMDEMSLSSGGGDIYIAGRRNATVNNLYGAGFINYSGTAGTTIDAGAGTITLIGETVDVAGMLDWGVMTGLNPNAYTGLFTLKSSNASDPVAISVTGNTASGEDGILIENHARILSSAATNGGGIEIAGASGSRNALSIGIGGNAGTLDVLSASGAITVDVGTDPLLVAQYGLFRLGSIAGDAVVPSSSADVSIISDNVAWTGSVPVVTSGSLTVAPSAGHSFTSTFDTASLNYTGITGLTIGHADNTGNVTIGSATTIAGPINIYGGDITINAALTATNNTISLTGSGNITDGVSGYLEADNLVLLGGNVTLDHASNNVNTLAANGVSGLTYIDSNALTIGSVGSTNGIAATGAVALTSGATLTSTQAINAGSSNITLSTDSLALGANVISTGALQIQPKTASTALGIGTGSGTMQIGADQLAWLQDGFSSITLGGSATGAVQVGGLSTWNDPLVAQAGTGADLLVVGNMSWSHANSLTLKAGNNIVVNANLAASNAAAALNILYGGTNGTTAPTVGTNYYVNLANRNTIQLTGSAPILKLGNTSYTVVNDVTALQGMSASGNYALGHGLSLAGTSYSTAFYTPTFTGKFDGLGNTLDGLTISNTAGGNLGLFAQVNGATVRQVGVTNMSITTNSTDLGTSANTTEYRVGGVVGNVGGAGAPTSSVTTLDGIWSTGTISTTAGSGQKFFLAGGLVGSQNGGTMNLSRSYSLANVSSQGSYSSNLAIGGLIGDIGINTSLLAHTATTSGTVAFTISKDYSTGSIVEGNHGAYFGTGGLVGVVFSSGNSILDSYSWSNVVGNSASFGGIAGFALAGTYDRLYTTQNSVGNMTGGTGTSVYNASTLNTSGGTVLPAGFSSNDWSIGSRPTLKLIPAPPTQIYVKESTSSGIYGAASTAYQLVDASGNPITLGMGNYTGLSGTTGTAHYSLDVGNTTTPGTYSLSYLSGLSFTGANALDFILNPYSTATSYTISKAPITVTANNASKVYDGLVYSGYSVSYNSFANGETSSVLGGTLSFSGTSQAATNSGTYTIVPSGLSSNNYSFTYVNGSLNIDKRPLTLSGSRTYDGTTGISVGALIASNLVGSDCASGLAACGMTGSASVASKNVSAGSQALTLSGLTLGSTITDNYTLAGASGTAVITAKTVTLSASKTYDGTTDMTGTTGIGTGVGSETLTYTGATASDAHVATASKYISALTLADATDLSGGLASNYQLPTLDATNASVTISTKALTASASIGGTLVKTYDGTTSATAANVSGSVLGAVSGDTILLDTSGVALAYDSAHVANASGISVSSGSAGFSIDSSSHGSQADDYSLTAPTIANVTASITPATLTPTLSNTGTTKTYDGTMDAPAGFAPSWSFGGLVSGDTAATLSSTGLAYNSKDVASAATLTVSGLAITGITGSNSSQLTDYGLDAVSKNVAAGITAKLVTVSGLAAANKTYDGANTTSVTNWGSVSTGVNSETLVLNHGSAIFDDINAGSAKTITASGYTLADGSNGGQADNYTLTVTSATTTADIATAPLAVTVNNDARFLTQADVAGYNGVSYSGLVGGETDTVVTAGSITRTNMGAANGVSDPAGNYTGVLVPAGYSSGNYAITYVNGNYTIVPADQLLVKVTNTSATYGTAPVFSIASAEYLNGSNVLTTLTQSGASGNTSTWADAAGGSATFTLIPNGASTSSSGNYAVGNYAITGDSTSIVGSNFTALNFAGNLAVTQKSLTASASNVGKVYDSTTTMAGVTLGLTGLVSNDVVSAGGSGMFATHHAGSGLGYSVNGIALSGADADNYYLSNTSLSGNNGAISQAPLTISGITASDKVYNANTTATVDTTAAVYGGLFSGDSVIVTATGVFADPNVGTNKIVTLASNYSGSSLADYAITDQANTTATITPALLTVSGTSVANKVYDGTAVATLTGGVLGGTIYAGDSVTLATQTGTFLSPNVGSGIAVTAADSLGGSSAGNYALIQPTGLVADITAALPSTTLRIAQAGAIRPVSNINLPAYAQPRSIAGSTPVTIGSGASSESNTGDATNSSSATKVNVEMTLGELGPTLKIENGGIRLPPNIARVQDEKKQGEPDDKSGQPQP